MIYALLLQNFVVKIYALLYVWLKYHLRKRAPAKWGYFREREPSGGDIWLKYYLRERAPTKGGYLRKGHLQVGEELHAEEAWKSGMVR